MARYFVGNGTNWSSTSSWASSSGGSSGASVPSSTDDVFLDGNSPGNLTIDVAASCQSLNCTGFTHTLTHTAAITLSIGSSTAGASNVALTLVSGMTYTLGNAATSAISFVSTSATQQTIDFGSKTGGNVTFSGSGGSWVLSSGVSLGPNLADMTLTAGTLNTNGVNVTARHFLSNNSNTRTLTLGSSAFTVSSNGSGNIWDFTTTTGLTFSAGTSTISASGVNTGFIGGGQTYNNVSLTPSGGGMLSLTGVNTFNNLTVTANSNSNGAISNNQTITGILTLTSVNSNNNMGVIRSGTVGTTQTLTAAIANVSNVFLMDIAAAGAAAPFSTTYTGDMGGNSGINFTAGTTRYWVATAGGNWNVTTSWSASSGGSSGASMPLPQDTAVFDSNSITATGKTITIVTACTPTIDFTNLTNSPTITFQITNGTTYVIGNLKLISGLTVSSGTSAVIFSGRGSYTITTAGITLASPIQFTAPSGTYTLQDNMTVSSTIGLVNGTLNANNNNVTCTLFNSNNTNTRTLTMGSGTWTVTGTGNVWQFTTIGGLTLNANTSTLVISDTSSSSKTISHGGLMTLNSVTITGGGTGAIIFGANGLVINALTVTNAPTTLTFTSGSTTTFSSFSATGTSGNLITINASTSGTQATLSCASGIISCDYMSIQDSKATGGAAFYAGTHSTNVSNNTGWAFNAPPSGSGNLFLLLQ